MEAKELMELGLTKNQAEVYIALIKKPEQTAGKLAKKLAIDRTFVYGILSSLIDKGLVGYVTKENKRIFQPLDPENLIKEIEEKRAKALKTIEKLQQLKKLTKEETAVKVYEGKAGLKAYIRDFLESGFFHTLGGGGQLSILESLKYEYPHYLKELSKKKIKGQVITSLKNAPKLKKIFNKTQVEIRTLENIESQANFTIFKNKLAIYSAEEKPFVIIIEDQTIAKSLKNYFVILWNTAKSA